MMGRRLDGSEGVGGHHAVIRMRRINDCSVALCGQECEKEICALIAKGELPTTYPLMTLAIWYHDIVFQISFPFYH